VAGEALSLPSQAATAVALVVNEMVQNAVEHAFAGQARGTVWIEIGRNQNDHILTVRDNGSGIAQPLRPGLGLEIAHTLIDEDLHGSVTFAPAHPGTLVTLRFPAAG
jgi:two-component sensor histidine kinase